jgi:hypothetical protein
MKQARDIFIQRFVLDQRRKSSAFFKLSPVERARLAATDPFLDALNFDPNRAAPKQSIVDRLTDEQLVSILKGETIRIATSSLTADEREYVQKEVASHGSSEMVDNLVFSRGRGPFDGSISLDFEGVGGVAALGGIWSQKALEQRASDGWISSSETHEFVDAPFPAPGIMPKKDDLPLAMAPHFLSIQTVARLGRLNVVLDASQEGSSGSSRPMVPTRLSEVINELEKSRALLWKTHGRFFLFAPLYWEHANRLDVLPWRPLKRLRESAASHGGYLTPEDWFFMAEFSRPQLQYLETEFPDARQVARLQGVLRMVAAFSEEERAAVARPGGAGWETWSGRTKQRILVTFPEEEAQRTRFYLSWQTDQKPAKVSVYVGIGEGAALTLTFKPRVDPELAPPIIPFSPPQ